MSSPSTAGRNENAVITYVRGNKSYTMATTELSGAATVSPRQASASAPASAAALVAASAPSSPRQLSLADLFGAPKRRRSLRGGTDQAVACHAGNAFEGVCPGGCPGRVRWGCRRPAARGTRGRSDLRKIIVRITPTPNPTFVTTFWPPFPCSSQHSGQGSPSFGQASQNDAGPGRTTVISKEFVWRTAVLQHTRLEDACFSGH